MNMHHLLPNRLFTAIVVIGIASVFLGVSNVNAKDTDVYLKSPQVSRDDAPNMMILLDNSGSMETNNVTTAPAYDATTTYTGSYNTSRIYWSTNGSIPSSSTNNWFPVSDNKCTASLSNLGNGAGATGYYASDHIVGWIWKTSGRWTTTTDLNHGRWNNLQGGTNSDGNRKMADVECSLDNPADATLGTYLTDSSNSNLNYSSRYTSSTSGKLDFTPYNTPTLYSANYLNYKANPPGAVTQTRMQVAKDAVKTIIDSNKAARFGLMVFNRNDLTPDGGRVLMRIDTMTDDRRALMKTIVDNISGYADPPTNNQSNYTPLAESLWEAYRYFSGGTVTYGNPSPAQSPAQDSCAQNVSNSYCNNGGVYQATTGKYSSGSSIVSGTADSTYNTGTYLSPFKYGCQRAYILIVTDGGPTNDDAADSSIQSLTGASCSFNNSDPTTSCMKDLAGWMHNNDVNSMSGDQKVNTYTVGFGSGIGVPEQTLLNATAANGGTGTAYFANSTEELTSALQNAITNAAQTNSSFSSPSLSVNAFNRLYNRDEVYFALFKPSTQMGWDGNVKKFRLCNATDVTAYGCTYGDVIDSNNTPAIDSNSRIKDTAVSFWSSTADGATVTAGGAGGQVAAPRTLYTYLGSYTGLSSSTPATPETIEAASPAGGSSTNAARNAIVADPTILGLPVTATSTDVDNLIDWMRGTGRSWNFADPLHSRPVAITFGAELTAGKPDPTKPIIKLFVGTNDGTIHIINNNTGAEEWSFIPKELLPYQYDLSVNADGEHIIGMDDTPSFWVHDVNNDGVIDPSAGDFVYMYIGMRRGVDAVNSHGFIYAFDVTPSSSMTVQTDTVTPKLMWVIEGETGNFARLGQTWSRPKLVYIRTKCNGASCNTGDSGTDPVLIFGGGYDPTLDSSLDPTVNSLGNAIYIVDPYTGARIWWASSDTTATLVLPAMQYSIPSELTLTDSNGDGWIDRIYVGDVAGQIWRIDLGNQLDTDANGGSTGYVFADVGCAGGTRSDNCAATSNQDKRRFFYPPDVAQVSDPNFSTVADYDLVTIASGNREDPIDLLTNSLTPPEPVHNRLYAFRDYNYAFGPPASMLTATPTTPSAIQDSDLYDATANDLGSTNSATVDAAKVIIQGKKGFYINLQEQAAMTLPNGLSTTWIGEKGLAKTVIFNGTLYATTYIPANDSTAVATCAAAEGEGRYYAVNYLDGTPAFDLNGDGTTDTNDRSAVVGGGVPSEPVIVIREGGVSGLVGTSGGASNISTNAGNNKYRTYWYDD